MKTIITLLTAVTLVSCIEKEIKTAEITGYWKMMTIKLYEDGVLYGTTDQSEDDIIWHFRGFNTHGDLIITEDGEVSILSYMHDVDSETLLVGSTNDYLVETLNFSSLVLVDEYGSYESVYTFGKIS